MTGKNQKQIQSLGKIHGEDNITISSIRVSHTLFPEIKAEFKAFLLPHSDEHRPAESLLTRRSFMCLPICVFAMGEEGVRKS